ncbi:MAG: beta-hydroxyacyl-ACP dehydratase [Planctomycetes bacterium]|nr:beta-hydroxyacyl-ACP dehydratase [Planctomycetota bacterium]
MPQALVDFALVDVEADLVPRERIRHHLPQRFEFEMVERVCHLDKDAGIIVATRAWNEEDWWAKGHFPGRPLVPGVLMTEAAAQVATVLWKETAELEGITIGFGGLEKVRFRGQVTPPATMYFVAKRDKVGSKMASFPTQAFVDGRIVFEGTILGVSI